MPLLSTLGNVSSRAFGFTTAPQAPAAPVYVSGAGAGNNIANRPRNTITSDVGTWATNAGTITYTYQWYYGSTLISGATSSSILLIGAYVGQRMKVRITATNSIGSTSQDVLAPGNVLPTTPYAPTIGTATSAGANSVNITYTAPADNAGDTITQYMAQSSPGSITGTVSTSGSGTITVSGLTTGTAYTFQVYAYNSYGYSDPSASSNSATPAAAGPVNTVAPAVTGTATSGQTLSCSTGTWTGSPTSYAYQWQRGTTNISGATSSTYVLTATDVGNTVRCVVTATNAGGSTAANSNSTASVAAAPSGLYTFTSATFTQGGAYGQFGPTLTQARNGITAASGTSWVSNTAYLNTTGTQGGIIQWTVPITGSYRFDVYGAQGGQDGTANVAGWPGARVQGDYYLTQGQIVNLVVGQQGRAYNSGTDGNGTGWGGTTWGGGGGGGSFVWINGSTTTPLFVAGGGGGGGAGSNAANGGQTGTSGGAGGNSGAAGGTGGVSGASSVCGGGNGQGWNGGTTSGCGGSTVWANVYVDPTGAAGASGGQAIGAGGSYAAGGFGGGNGAYGGSGGGGGYSGGGSGGWYPAGGGGGGGSYNAGSNQVMTNAARSGNGQIIITKL